MRRLADKSDAFSELEGCLEGVREADSFMAAFWIKNGGYIRVKKVSWNFPVGDFLKVLGQLAHLLDEECRAGGVL